MNHISQAKYGRSRKQCYERTELQAREPGIIHTRQLPQLPLATTIIGSSATATTWHPNVDGAKEVQLPRCVRVTDDRCAPAAAAAAEHMHLSDVVLALQDTC